MARAVRVLLIGPLLALAATGCGTTVPSAAGAANAPGALPGGGLGPAAAPAGQSVALGGSATPAGAGASTSGGGTVSAVARTATTSDQSAGGAGTTQSASGPAMTTPGVTATTLFVGVTIEDDAGAANAALGASAVTSGDETHEYRAKVADLNAHHALGRRKIQLVEFHYDATTGATTSGLEQQACSYFTEDHKVAVVLNTAWSENGIACLTHKGVAVFGNSLSYSTDQTFARFPRYVEPIALSLTRLVQNYADGMESMKYFTPGAKVGFLTYDYPPFARATAQLKAALARHGRRIDEVETVTFPEQESDLSAEGADISSAILRFRSNGITHVMFLDPSAVSELLFMNQAESQGYRPRYGFGQSGAAALRSTGVPAAQFVGSLTVGWFPRLDGVPANEALYPPAEKKCLDLFIRNGIAFDSDNAKRHAADICDSFDILTTVADAAGSNLSADAIVAGVRQLGPTPGAGTYRLRLGGARRDGVDLVRYNAYAADCDCWHYLGGLRPAS